MGLGLSEFAMGSIVRLARPHPKIQAKAPATADELMAREEASSLTILLWSFGVSASVICLVVVVMLSRTWTEFAFISAFVLVLILLKIAVANALFYILVHCDKDRDRQVRQPEAVAVSMPQRPVHRRVGQAESRPKRANRRIRTPRSLPRPVQP
jgi:hypothetical protein